MSGPAAFDGHFIRSRLRLDHPFNASPDLVYLGSGFYRKRRLVLGFHLGIGQILYGQGSPAAFIFHDDRTAAP
ncbi:hypothetical protein D3C73_1626350 [compost metagenome]